MIKFVYLIFMTQLCELISSHNPPFIPSRKGVKEHKTYPLCKTQNVI